jgi:hypothetical protein
MALVASLTLRKNSIAFQTATQMRFGVGGRLKTGQWWSIQNQPLNWLVTGLALCWQDAFWRWDGNSAGKFCG